MSQCHLLSDQIMEIMFFQNFSEFAKIMVITNHTGHDENFRFLRIDVQLHCGVFAVHLKEFLIL